MPDFAHVDDLAGPADIRQCAAPLPSLTAPTPPGFSAPLSNAVAAVLAALPTGLLISDAHRRVVFINPAFERIIGLPPGLFRPGTAMEDVTRVGAHRGLFGPGDPEALASEMLAADDRVGRVFQRRRADGATFESQYIPLASGVAISINDTTQLTALRDQAERAFDRVHEAMAQLRVGLAVFGPDRRLGLHNAQFVNLMGMEDAPPTAGTPFGDVVRAAGRTAAFAGPSGSEFLTVQRAQDRSRASRTVWHRPDRVVVALKSDPLGTGGWTMTLLDITAQSVAEEEVKRRATLLETIITHLPSGVVVFSADQRLAVVNHAYRAIMHGAAASVGEFDRDIVLRQAKAGEFGPGDPDTLTAERMTALDHTKTGVHRRQRPTGQTIEICTAPLPDGGMIRVLNDVSGEVAATAAQTRHAETMATMLSHIRHGIVLWDSEQRIIAANSVVTDLLGAEPDLFVPGTLLDATIISALSRGNFGDADVGKRLAVALAQRDRTQSHVDQRVTRDGRVLEVRSDPTPGGGFVTTYTDITPIRQAEVAAQDAKATAERANLAKSGFLAAMSQELRRPLAQILDQAAMIVRDTSSHPVSTTDDTAPALAQAAKAIIQVGQSMLARLGNILDVARLEAGRFELADDVIALGALVRDALAGADQYAAAAEIVLSVDLPSPEPAIRGDRRRLLNALDHLIRHALALTRPGDVVTVGAACNSDGLTLTVTTPGALMGPAARERAFDPFSPSDDSTGQQAVLRLGLYASRIVLQAHGGTVQLHSEPGAGTSARIHLPPARVLVRSRPGRSMECAGNTSAQSV